MLVWILFIVIVVRIIRIHFHPHSSFSYYYRHHYRYYLRQSERGKEVRRRGLNLVISDFFDSGLVGKYSIVSAEYIKMLTWINHHYELTFIISHYLMLLE